KTMGFFCSSTRRHTRFSRDWSSDVCSSDLNNLHTIHCESFPTTNNLLPIHCESFPTTNNLLAIHCESFPTTNNLLPIHCESFPRSDERRAGKSYRSSTWSCRVAASTECSTT